MPESALRVVARGAAAGFAGTLLLSAVARLVPSLRSAWSAAWNARNGSERHGTPGQDFKAAVAQQPPEPAAATEPERQNPFAERAPAAHPGAEAVAAMTPAHALTMASGPSPEGAAERFALKLASGLFGRDIGSLVRPAGLAVHVLYGSFWGVVYAVFQSGLQWTPGLAGLLHGLGVWTVGPGWLVPAMRVMRHPDEQPLETNASMVAGHLLYGLAVSRVFESLARKAPNE